MSKRSYARLVLLILVMAFALTGCRNSYQAELEELQQKYGSLSTQYYALSENYNELESAYNKLQEEYEKLQNLPDIVVSLIDDRDKIIDLALYPSLEESQKAYAEYFCTIGSSVHQYNVTITCNSEEKLDDIYWVCDDGRIESVMDRVSSVDNTYILKVTTHVQYIHSLIIQYSDKTAYTSFYGTYHID